MTHTRAVGQDYESSGEEEGFSKRGSSFWHASGSWMRPRRPNERQAAARFGVGIATAIRWSAAVEATGKVATRSQGRARTSKLDPHEAFLCRLINEKDDITLEACPINEV